MAAQQKGAGVVWSADGITFTVGIVSASKGSIQSADFERRAEMVKIRGAGGASVARVVYDPEKVVNCTVVPTGTTIATAKTNADAWLPAIGTAVTVVDGDSTITDGVYCLTSAKFRRTVDGAAIADISMEMTEDNDTTTAIV